jgi:hypothetical protein
MLQGGILHPLHIGDIVDMPVTIHDLGGDDDFKAIKRFPTTRRWGWGAPTLLCLC